MKPASASLIGLLVGIAATAAIMAYSTARFTRDMRDASRILVETREQLHSLEAMLTKIEKTISSLEVNERGSMHASAINDKLKIAYPIDCRHQQELDCAQLNQHNQLIEMPEIVPEPPSHDVVERFETLRQRINDQVSYGSMTMTDVLNDAEMQNLPLSMQQEIVSSILTKVNSKEIGIEVVFPK